MDEHQMTHEEAAAVTASFARRNRPKMPVRRCPSPPDDEPDFRFLVSLDEMIRENQHR